MLSCADWAVKPEWAGCYSWEALPLIDSKTLYIGYNDTAPACSVTIGYRDSLMGAKKELLMLKIIGYSDNWLQ